MTNSQTTNPARAPKRPTAAGLALVVLCAGFMMIILDSTIVNVALPSIQEDLGFSQSSLAWVVNAYLIAFGGLLLLAGRLGDLIGRRRVFLSGLALFTAASLACGLAQSQELLIGARFIQGIGGALTSAVILGMIVTMFPEPREQAQGDRHLQLRRLRRRLDRPARRRRADPGDQLALDLLRQRPDRRRRPRCWRCATSSDDEGIGLDKGADVLGALLVDRRRDARRLHRPQGRRPRLGVGPHARRSAPRRSRCWPAFLAARGAHAARR